MSSQAKTENYGLCQYGDNDIPDWRTDYTGDMAVIDEQLKARADGENLINKEVTELKQELEETKKSVSDGKTKVATAITDKGVATESTDNFDTMAENIEKISSGGYVVPVQSISAKAVRGADFVVPVQTLKTSVYLGED